MPWFSAKDLKSLLLKDSEEHISEAAIADGAPIGKAGELLMLVRGMTLMKDVPVGVLCRDGSFNQDLKCLRALDGISSGYLGYMLAASRPRLMSMVDQAGHGTGRLAVERLLSLPIWKPNADVQEFIENMLRCVDNHLVFGQRLISAKRIFKRGLTQRLLTGQKRFPKFARSSDRQAGEFGTVPSDWAIVPIGEIAEEVKERGAIDGSVVYSCTKHDGLVPSLEYFGKQVFSRNLGAYKRLQIGDFAYATNHIEEGSIGVLQKGSSGLVSPMYTVFRPIDGVNRDFLFALLKTESYRRVFAQRTNASVNRRGSLRWNEFARIKVGVPSREEQDQIADTLRLANLEIRQLAKLGSFVETLKRALLNRLLSGEISVPA